MAKASLIGTMYTHQFTWVPKTKALVIEASSMEIERPERLIIVSSDTGRSFAFRLNHVLSNGLEEVTG